MHNSDWRHLYHEPKSSVAVIETFVITLFSVLLGYWFMAEYDYFAAPGFTWLILGPLLSGLRFGLLYALISLFLLASMALWGHNQMFSWAQAYPPIRLGLQLLVVTVLAGEFHRYWRRRLGRLNAAALYLNERFSELSHAFNMLKHSHNQLEQIQASKITLRESISTVRRQILLSSGDKADFYGLGELILKVLANLGSLQGVSLYALNPKTSQIIVPPVAAIGPIPPLDVQSPLLVKSITSRKAVALKLDLITQNRNEPLLSIPLVDVYDNVLGVIIVTKMPFRAYREDNIQLLSVLGGYLGDLLSTKLLPDKSIQNEDLQCFYIQSKRCMQDAANYHLAASFLGIEFSNTVYADKLLRLITQQQRSLDQLLLLENKYHNPVALLILPLTDQDSVERYLTILKNSIKAEFGSIPLEALGFHYAVQVLSVDKPLAECLQLLTYRLNVENVFAHDAFAS